MAKLDLDWLNVFIEIYKTQSVSRAAQALGMEQASASLVLNKLRRHFDDPLFCRTLDGMAPTPRAQTIYPDLMEAILRIEKARGITGEFMPQNASREFRICMTDISEIVLLPRLINHLQTIAPGIIIAAEKISPDSRRRLESGDVDLAVGFTPDLEAGFYQQALFAQDFVCLASSKHPRIATKLTLKTFLAEGHIQVIASGTGHSIVDKVLTKNRVERRIVLRVPSFLGVARIVASTDFLVIVPRQLGNALTQQESVKILESPFPLPNYKVKQHWHERFNQDPVNIWLRKTMLGLFAATRFDV
jgi:DNA-binding transcriptional LysR family regulator